MSEWPSTVHCPHGNADLRSARHHLTLPGQCIVWCACLLSGVCITPTPWRVARLGWPEWLGWITCPETVTHRSSNRARRRSTMLIESSSVLLKPNRQTPPFTCVDWTRALQQLEPLLRAQSPNCATSLKVASNSFKFYFSCHEQGRRQREV